MKKIDKNKEKRVWIVILFTIPIIIFILWKDDNHLGVEEIIIFIMTLIIEISSFYYLKNIILYQQPL